MAYYEYKMKLWQLRQKQSVPLNGKINMSKKRIEDWYNYYNGEVYISFSGGKDSLVMQNIVWKKYPDVKSVFVNTGLEYPEIVDFVKEFDIKILRPKISFKQVLDTHGYPVISKKVARQIRDLQNPTDKNIATRNLYLTGIKRDGSKSKHFKLPEKWHFLINAPFKISEKCCDVMKKEPFRRYEKKTGKRGFTGTMAFDSQQRESSYLKTGCNNFKKGLSHPIAFWTEQDIWNYIKKNKLTYCPIYDTGVKRTGCIFCMFGVHLEKEPNRFQLMKKTHPSYHNYCIYKLGIGKILNFIGVEYILKQKTLTSGEWRFK